MCPAWQPAQHIFSPDDGKSPRLQRPVDCRDKHDAAGFQHFRTLGDEEVDIGHMLHHLHVEDDIEALALFRKRLGRLGTIINLKAAFGGMQLCHLDIERRRIRTDHVCTKPRHRRAKMTNAAVYGKNTHSCEWLGRAWITAELRGNVVAYIS